MTAQAELLPIIKVADHVTIRSGRAVWRVDWASTYALRPHADLTRISPSGRYLTRHAVPLSDLTRVGVHAPRREDEAPNCAECGMYRRHPVPGIIDEAFQ
jgi:hypothetical protein